MNLLNCRYILGLLSVASYIYQELLRRASLSNDYFCESTTVEYLLILTAFIAVVF